MNFDNSSFVVHFTLDQTGVLFLGHPEARIDKLFALLEHISKEKLVSARFIAKLMGSIISVSLGVGPVCRLWTRMLYREVQKLFLGIKKFFISMEAKEEVAFWYYSFHKYNGQPIWPSSPKISVLTYSDASSLAWNGYSINLQQKETFLKVK